MNSRLVPSASRLRAASLATVAALALLLPSLARAQNPGLVTRMSVTPAGGNPDRSSHEPAVSADGAVVAFESEATDIVPNDTNDNSDVFVHDARTGITQRVSVAWNGMEARDDSRCPALSADGRIVAFASRAWNMYPGGANLGHPRWDVYVHDRQSGVTTRISVARDGGDPNEDSGCPSISDDGTRVAFNSRASNLVKKDDNQWSDVFLVDLARGKTRLISKALDGKAASGPSHSPAISGDGRIVAFVSGARNLVAVPTAPPGGWAYYAYVRDLASGTTEMVDVAANHPIEPPNGGASDVAISGDGRFVVFESLADNLDLSYTGYSWWPNVFVRDRVGGATTLINRHHPLIKDCSIGGVPRVCQPHSSFRPQISRDGRFITFGSYSQQLAPMTLYRSANTFLYDRVSGRMRLLSVDRSGLVNGGCGGGSAPLSADGRVIAYSTDAGLVGSDDDGEPDVYRQNWTCAASGACRELAACPPQPAACAPATSSTLRLRKHPPGGVHEDRLFWRWSGGADATPLPDPSDDARYQLCIYAGEPRAMVMDVALPQAPECKGSARPCWRLRPDHQQLLDPRGGVAKLTVTRSASGLRILARGEGPLLDAPYLPLVGANGVVAQLQDATSGRCWGVEIPATGVKKNNAGLVAPGSVRDGVLSASFP